MLQKILPEVESVDEFCSNFAFAVENLLLGSLPYDTNKEALRLFFSVAIFQLPTLLMAETFGQSPSAERGDAKRVWGKLTSYSFHSLILTLLFPIRL
jgi:hypothetical protein